MKIEWNMCGKVLSEQTWKEISRMEKGQKRKAMLIKYRFINVVPAMDDDSMKSVTGVAEALSYGREIVGTIDHVPVDKLIGEVRIIAWCELEGDDIPFKSEKEIWHERHKDPFEAMEGSLKRNAPAYWPSGKPTMDYKQ